MVRVAIVEDDRAIQSSLRGWIDEVPSYTCCCVAASAREALQRIPEAGPDVVLMDIQLPGTSGIECTAGLRQIQPKLPVILLIAHRDPKMIFRALRAGACGFVSRPSTRREVIDSIAEVHAGGGHMPPDVARLVVESFCRPEPMPETLTHRENEILALVALGLTNLEIGSRLDICFDTVRNHLRHIYEKLHVHSRTEAARVYLER